MLNEQQCKIRSLHARVNSAINETTGKVAELCGGLINEVKKKGREKGKEKNRSEEGRGEL